MHDVIEAMIEASCNEVVKHGPFPGSPRDRYYRKHEVRILAALRAAEAAGYILAPREPTDEMVAEIADYAICERHQAKAGWAAAIQAGRLRLETSDA